MTLDIDRTRTDVVERVVRHPEHTEFSFLRASVVALALLGDTVIIENSPDNFLVRPCFKAGTMYCIVSACGAYQPHPPTRCQLLNIDSLVVLERVRVEITCCLEGEMQVTGDEFIWCHVHPVCNIRAACGRRAIDTFLHDPCNLYTSKMSYSKKVVEKSDKTARLRKARWNAEHLIKDAGKLRKGERQCKAIKSSGERCKKSSIVGGFVCPTHGGAAPQVRAKANKRLLALVEPSLIRLGALVQQSEHMPTALGAIRTVLERAGTVTPIGPLGKDTGDRDSRPIVTIGIALGGLTPDKMKLLAAVQTENPLPDVEGETVDEDDDE